MKNHRRPNEKRERKKMATAATYGSRAALASRSTIRGAHAYLYRQHFEKGPRASHGYRARERRERNQNERYFMQRELD